MLLKGEEAMARSDTRYSVYPAPKAVEIVGNSAPALNLAIECWGALLARAMADNSNESFPLNPEGTRIGHLTGKFEDMHDLHEWALFADVFKEMRFDPEFANPGELLATAVEDAHRLERSGEKWFSSDFDMEEYVRGLDYKVKEVLKKLRGLDYPHAWAIIVTVQWLWEHHEEGIDIKKDPWWTLAFRRKWGQPRANKPAERRKTRGSKKV
jgi:hypothetical protein